VYGTTVEYGVDSLSRVQESAYLVRISMRRRLWSSRGVRIHGRGLGYWRLAMKFEISVRQVKFLVP